MNALHHRLKLGAWTALALSLIAGALLPLSLAPLNIWPIAILSPALLLFTLQQSVHQHFIKTIYAFGIGLFGVGASWVYVSIHDFGYTGMPLAVLLTGLFVAGLALVFTLPFTVLTKLERNSNGFLLAFIGLWVLGEWLRSWLLTGFPWLYVGYSQITTPLVGWASSGGVFLLSLLTILSAATLTAFVTPVSALSKYVWCGVTLFTWLTGSLLQDVQWTKPAGAGLSVSIVQANIPQEKKWQPDYRVPTLNRYNAMTQPLVNSDWIIWPEAAIPVIYQSAQPFLQDLDRFAKKTHTALLTGIIYDDSNTGFYHNSAIALGQGAGRYHKTRLVPFGEYVPLESLLRGAIEFFNLPMSSIKPGLVDQPPLAMGDYLTGMAICYEVVYPDLVAARARETHVLTTLSNDAWFGRSWGPLQHLQMAQMRAIETQRYVIRSTNNGVSAIIKPDGSTSVASQQFIQETITGEVTPLSGQTPFMVYGSWPTIFISALLFIYAWLRTKRHPHRPPSIHTD